MCKTQGFTLLELLVIIAVIGLLSTLALVALNNARAKARDSRRMADVQQIRRSLEIREDALGIFPNCISANCPANSNELGVDLTCLDTDFPATPTVCTGTTYMAKIPQDPANPINGTGCVAGSGVKCNYSYRRCKLADCTAAITNNYEIYYRLESGSGGFSSGVHCATELGMGNSNGNACAH